MWLGVTLKKTPLFMESPQVTTDEIPSQIDPLCLVLTISDKHDTSCKQGLAHHIQTTKLIRQIAHLALYLLIFPRPQKVKDDLIDLLSAQAGKGTTDPVYHKPDKAKVLIIMDLPFRDKF